MSRLTQTFLLALTVAFASLVVSQVAHARPGSDLQATLGIYGEPANLGVIVSGAGASTTNASTAAPFTINAGAQKVLAIRYVCNAAGFITPGGTCSTAIGNAAYGQPVTNLVAGTMFIKDTTTTLSICGSAAITCQIWAIQ